jgi:hypothetical protein
VTIPRLFDFKKQIAFSIRETSSISGGNDLGLRVQKGGLKPPLHKERMQQMLLERQMN